MWLERVAEKGGILRDQFEAWLCLMCLEKGQQGGHRGELMLPHRLFPDIRRLEEPWGAFKQRSNMTQHVF